MRLRVVHESLDTPGVGTYKVQRKRWWGWGWVWVKTFIYGNSMDYQKKQVALEDALQLIVKLRTPDAEPKVVFDTIQLDSIDAPKQEAGLLSLVKE